MKALISTGSFDLYNPFLVPAGIRGSARCEAGASFRYKNIWTMTGESGNSTKEGLTGAQGVLWRTPTTPFVLTYVSVRFLTNLVGTLQTGPDFSTLSWALMLSHAGGASGLINATPPGFVGNPTATYDIASARSLFSMHVDGGFLTNDYNTGTQGGAVGGKYGGAFPVFHAYDGDWFGYDVWLTFHSQPVAWTMTGSVELTVCGHILG